LHAKITAINHLNAEIIIIINQSETSLNAVYQGIQLYGLNSITRYSTVFEKQNLNIHAVKFLAEESFNLRVIEKATVIFDNSSWLTERMTEIYGFSGVVALVQNY
jgi:hypothetical protein